MTATFGEETGSSRRPRVLYVSDLGYQARGRRYGDEDIALTARLRDDFDIAVCHPLDVTALMGSFDAVVVRNSGPVLNYQAAFDDFRSRALQNDVRAYPQLTGRADMAGKQYLLDLSAAGYPVIATIDSRQDIDRLPETDEYVIKPKLGADSHGLRFASREQVERLAFDGSLVQPRIRFEYEVSFYFIDRAFQYALYAPRPDRRWELKPYRPTDADLAFAQRFVDWNDIEQGIQRVDACRDPGGELLLVELEDLNPYLSLDRVPAHTRDSFVTNMKSSLQRLLDRRPAV